MARIVFYECLAEDRANLRSAVEESGLVSLGDCEFLDNKLSPETAYLAKDASAVSVFVNSKTDKETIAALPSSVKLIATRSTGFDHIDLAAAKARGIAVSNVPAYGSRTVAEYAFAIILALSRKLVDADLRCKSGDMSTAGLMGFDLQGKTLGIVGTGHIGHNVAQIAKGFDMKVVAYDPFPDNEAASKIGFSYLPLKVLLEGSDVVTLHVPLNDDTRHLINIDNIESMKRGSILINTARGEVCDTVAIVKGLKEGILAGAGLDVVEGDRSELAKMRNVILTPHSAYFTKEAEDHICRTTVENIANSFSGKLQNVVG